MRRCARSMGGWLMGLKRRCGLQGGYRRDMRRRGCSEGHGLRRPARTGQLRWKPALDSVIGGTWAGARRDERKVTDTDRGVERAVRMVQGAAGALLLRWHKIGERARRWAAHREVLRGRASVVLHAWRAVCERQRGQWRMSSRQGRERREEEDGSDELTPRWMAEWSYRPGVSAVTPGTWGGWLMAYARAHAVARRAERRRWAAWRVRVRRGGTGRTGAASTGRKYRTGHGRYACEGRDGVDTMVRNV